MTDFFEEPEVIEQEPSKTYNSKEFMEAAGIRHQPSLSRWIKKGIVNPTKDNGKLVFTELDLERLQEYTNSPSKHEFTVTRQQALEQRVARLEELVEQLMNTKES